MTEEVPLEGWPDLLATFVKAHLVRHKESHPEERLSTDHVLEALRLAVTEGGPELATQAEAELERTEPVKAGESVAYFSEATPGEHCLECEMRWGSHSWPVADYGDRLGLLQGVRIRSRERPFCASQTGDASPPPRGRLCCCQGSQGPA